MIYGNEIRFVPKSEVNRLREKALEVIEKNEELKDENLALIHECNRLNEKLDRIESLYKSLIKELGGK